MPATIVWFRRDLRLRDHAALSEAAARGAAVVPVYVHAPEEERPWVPGEASRWWLNESLAALDSELRRRGSRLVLRTGPSAETLIDLAHATGADRICWQRFHEPHLARRDAAVAKALRAAGLEVIDFAGQLLHDPAALAAASGGAYRVYTPFWRTLETRLNELPPALPVPRVLPGPRRWPRGVSLATLAVAPRRGWTAGLARAWRPGEAGAERRLRALRQRGLARYRDARDRPADDSVSRLSPHLHFGEISPRSLWRALEGLAGACDFRRELAWREFAHHVLHHNPDLPTRPLRAKYARFAWRRNNSPLLAAWRQGRTGYPLVDAGMRELWATGWMHNRVRMVAASFLTKHARVPWQEGARWFWDTLVDADLANNSFNWQWVAGCGADAAPYFRIFNPVLQGKRFDPEGSYVRRWLPELARVPTRYVHEPWRATADASDYPPPVLDLAQARAEALAGFAALRRG